MSYPARAEGLVNMITIGIIVTCKFHSFFNSLPRSRFLSFFSHSFSFIVWSAGTAKSTILQVPFFLLIIIKSGLLAGIRWSTCMSKSHMSSCVLFCRTGAGLYIYHLLIWPNLNSWRISLWITSPTQSCLVLYSFCANFMHSLIMWLRVSSLSPHSLHLLFCCVLSIFALIWLVLTALFCAAISRDYFSLLNFPFLSHVQVSSCEMLFINRLFSLPVLHTSVSWWSYQDSSLYSGRFQRYRWLDGVGLSSDFQFCQPPYQAIGDRSKSTNISITLILIFYSFLSSLAVSKYLSLFSLSPGGQSQLYEKCHHFFTYYH